MNTQQKNPHVRSKLKSDSIWMLGLMLASFFSSHGLADVIEFQKPVALSCVTSDGYKLTVAKGQRLGEADECSGGQCGKQGSVALELVPYAEATSSSSEWIEVTCKDCPLQSPLTHGLLALPPKTLETSPKTTVGSYYVLSLSGLLSSGDSITCQLQPSDKTATVVSAAAAAPTKLTSAPPTLPPVILPANPNAPVVAASTSGHIDPELLKPNCAEKVILSAAITSVAKIYDNRSVSGGKCAMGVREVLERSKVGEIQGSLGNAIDFLETLKTHGFVDTGLRDPNKAPIGAIIILAGPKSDQYLKKHSYGRPAGTWLGHVTIKGDGYYYTDGRTKEPAIGWSHGTNIEHIRNVVGIYVPDHELIAEYKNKCN